MDGGNVRKMHNEENKPTVTDYVTTMPMCNCKYSPHGKDEDQLVDDLLTAAKEGEIKILQVLVKGKHVDLNAVSQKSKYQQGLTALHLAVRHSRKECLELLIKAGANVDVEDRFHFRPIHDAALQGQLECLNLLLNAKCKTTGVETKRLRHITPLHYAIQQNHTECIKSLQQHSRIEQTHQEQLVMWDLCSKRGHPSLLDLQVSDDALPMEEQFPEWLFNSALSGHTTFLQRVKQQLKRPFAAGEAQMALIPAAQHGRTDYLLYLLENGADPNVKSDYHQATPLHYAARYGHKDSIEVLVNYGANLEARTAKGWTALHTALTQGQAESVAKLVQMGCDVNRVGGSHNDTALHLAAKCCVERQPLYELLQGGPSLSIKNKDGKMPAEIPTHDDIAQILKTYAYDRKLADRQSSLSSSTKQNSITS